MAHRHTIYLHKRPFGACAAALMGMVLSISLLAGCTAQGGQPDADSSEPSESSASAETEKIKLTQADGFALEELIGDVLARKLVAQAQTDDNAAWIASHSDAFDIDGIEVQVKILKLAAAEPAALGFVRSFPDNYPKTGIDMTAEPAAEESDFSAELQSNVPHFFQWDPRWGLTVYSSTAFGLTGCGPTSMAMIYQGMTGKTDLTPYDMAVRAEQAGFMTEFNGTAVEHFYHEAEQAGFYCYEMDTSAENILDTLREGNLVIANVGEGYFTEGGHFFVLAGLTKNGQVIVNDPYSFERSSKAWDAEFIAGESIALFGFSNEEHDSYASPFDDAGAYGETPYDEGAFYDESAW